MGTLSRVDCSTPAEITNISRIFARLEVREHLLRLVLRRLVEEEDAPIELAVDQLHVVVECLPVE